ncbi:unnamed protein product [Calypogeia fissa]
MLMLLLLLLHDGFDCSTVFGTIRFFKMDQQSAYLHCWTSRCFPTLFVPPAAGMSLRLQVRFNCRLLLWLESGSSGEDWQVPGG